MLARTRAALARAPHADCQQAAAFGADFQSVRICESQSDWPPPMRRFEAAVVGGSVVVVFGVVVELVVAKLPCWSLVVHQPEVAG